jgi:hypothetical protein
MKKILVVAMVAAVAAIFATSVSAVTGGTVVDSGFTCVALDGNGSPTVYTTNSTVTVYDSGKVVMKCNGYGAGASKLTYFDYASTGYSCNIPGFGSTWTWSDKVGRNGNSQLTCTGWMNTDPVSRVSSGGQAGVS